MVPVITCRLDLSYVFSEYVLCAPCTFVRYKPISVSNELSDLYASLEAEYLQKSHQDSQRLQHQPLHHEDEYPQQSHMRRPARERLEQQSHEEEDDYIQQPHKRRPARERLPEEHQEEDDEDLPRSHKRRPARERLPEQPQEEDDEDLPRSHKRRPARERLQQSPAVVDYGDDEYEEDDEYEDEPPNYDV
jgi:hypothetical protein